MPTSKANKLKLSEVIYVAAVSMAAMCGLIWTFSSYAPPAKPIIVSILAALATASWLVFRGLPSALMHRASMLVILLFTVIPSPTNTPLFFATNGLTLSFMTIFPCIEDRKAAGSRKEVSCDS